MRLPDIEEKLHQLAQRRWGSDLKVRVELDEDSGRLRIALSDNIELIGHAPDQRSLLTEAYRLLGQYLKQIEPWIANEQRLERIDPWFVSEQRPSRRLRDQA